MTMGVPFFRLSGFLLSQRVNMPRCCWDCSSSVVTMTAACLEGADLFLTLLKESARLASLAQRSTGRMLKKLFYRSSKGKHVSPQPQCLGPSRVCTFPQNFVHHKAGVG